MLEEAAEESLGRVGVPSLLDPDVQCLAVRIDGSPQAILLAPDLYEYLVQVPDAAGSPLAPAQFSREALTEFLHPGTHGLVADHDPALEQQLLYIVVAQGEPMISQTAWEMISAGKRCRWKWPGRSGMGEQSGSGGADGSLPCTQLRFT